MTLKPRESKKTEFIQILKSKHARYIDGMVVVDRDSVSKEYVPPGCALGQINSSGLYGPVTRDKVNTAGADSANNFIPLQNLDNSKWHNWQVGDELICDPGGTGEETAVVTAIDRDTGKLEVDSITVDHSEGVIIQKNDGTSKAELVCLEMIDVSLEDAVVGGLLHGAVYSDRMPNYDSIVAEDIPQINFE